MNIRSSANKLSKSALTSLVVNLYGIYGDIDEIIEHHLAAAEYSDQPLADMLHRQIEQLQREDEFIGYHSSYAFSCRLQSLLLDINTLLREQDTEQALRLTEAFLLLVDSIFKRCDDSDGDIGELFREAVDQWLDIAAELRATQADSIDWVEKVLCFFDNNDYGCFDNVIANSRNLLTEDELKQLAWRFENQARKALDEPSDDQGYNFEVAHACIGICSVAEALDDMALYEKSVLITSPQPNTLQIAGIIQFALEIKKLERAEYWLKQPEWQQDKTRQKTLQNELLKLQGNVQQLKQNLLDDFINTPNDFTLSNYWKFADEQERQAIQSKVATLAKASNNVQEAISMLLMVGNMDQAAHTVITHASQLDELYYGTLLNWVELFENNQQALATIVCYRALLSDLLNRGYSKAYHHGAHYFHQLLELDRHIDDYQELMDAQAFIKLIQKNHWRKRSFWAEANYPNKPE